MEHRKNILNFSDAIVIGVLSLFRYLFSYNYELGIKKYYQLPDMFIEVDLTSVIQSAGILFAFLYFMVLLSNLVFEFYPSQNSPLAISLKRIFWISLLAFSFLYAMHFSKAGFIIFTTILLFISFLEFVLPLIHFKTKGYLNKLEKSQWIAPNAFIAFTMDKYGSSPKIYYFNIHTTYDRMHVHGNIRKSRCF